MTGSVPTVKVSPLLASPPTVTTTSPVVAPSGTVTVIEVALHSVGVASVPLKVTLLLPCTVPKLVPVISTAVPSGPATGLRLPIAGVTVKVSPLLASPPTVTTTSPVAAPSGTVAVIEVSLQLVAVAGVPLKLTVLAPRTAPKLVPAISTDAPSGPESGLRLAIAGATVKVTPSLAVPSTVTTTSPVVAPIGTAARISVSLQLVAVAATPLKLTVLVPCDAPKCTPVISTAVPSGPDTGSSEPTDGTGPAVTVNATRGEATPPTVTTTSPVVAPSGTSTTIFLSLQLS